LLFLMLEVIPAFECLLTILISLKRKVQAIFPGSDLASKQAFCSMLRGQSEFIIYFRLFLELDLVCQT
jgi:hypothetical protein